MHNVEKKYTYTDSSNVKHSIVLKEDDFVLSQKDKSIHDTKFKTKPTTFLKDAFKRFCKNKSSVTGAIILGLLLILSFVVPFADPYDIDVNHPQERLLEPKLFDAGTGFWDGTRQMRDIVCNPSISTTDEAGNVYYYPDSESYATNAVMNLSLPRENNEINTPSRFVSGGYVNLTNTNSLETESIEGLESNKITMSSYSYAFDMNNTYGLEIVFGNEEIENYAQGNYRIYLSYEVESSTGTSGYEYTGVLDTHTPSEDEPDTDESTGVEVALPPFLGIFEGSLNETPYTIIINKGELISEAAGYRGSNGYINGTEFIYTIDSVTNDADGNPATYVLSASDEGFDLSMTYDVATDALTVRYVVNQIEEYVLRDYSSSEAIDLSNYKTEDMLEGINLPQGSSIASMSINIDVQPAVSETSYLLIKSINITTDSTVSEEVETIQTMSFSDANASLLVGNTSRGYWRCNGGKGLYHGTGYVCDFTYDTYEAVYGETTQVVPKVNFDSYVRQGWIQEIDFSRLIGMSQEQLAVAFESYKTDLTDKHCPVNSIISVSGSSVAGIEVYTITCNVSKYKLLGYSNMPRFLWGTDRFGKDLLKTVFVGLRNSLLLGICVFAVCFTIGLIWGSVCGYYGGNIDLILERFTDFLSGVPWIVIMTLCVLNLGSNFGVFILAMCMTGWIGTASLTRTQFYRFRDREYTLASRTLGASNFRLIFKHILPNAMGTIITSSVLMIPSVIFSEATISYLGLGFQDMTSLGVTLSENQQYLSTYSYLILLPSAIMALIMISFNLFGNGLRDAFNPSLKGSE